MPRITINHGSKKRFIGKCENIEVKSIKFLEQTNLASGQAVLNNDRINVASIKALTGCCSSGNNETGTKLFYKYFLYTKHNNIKVN